MKSNHLSPVRIIAIIVLLLLAFAAFEYLRQVPLDRVGSRHLSIEVPPGASARLLVVGDTGANIESQRTTALLMEKLCLDYGPQAILFLGDNFSNDGVASTDDPQWEEQFEKMYGGPCLGEVPVFAILGNHDYKGDAGAQIRYTGKGSGRWHLPARAYSLRFGDLLTILAMDTNFPDKCYVRGFCSLDWLEAEAERLDSRWTIVLGHAPVVSGGKYRSLKLYQQWVIPDFLCRVQPDFYFSGHDHNFQHIVASVPGRDDCPLNHVTVGTGGAPLVPVEALPEMTRFARQTLGAGVVQINEGKMRFEFFEAESGDKIYSYEQAKPPGSS